MTPKVKITREEILHVALLLLKESGESAINARSLASVLGCSTQPIFRVYKNMEELAEDLFAKACDFFQDYYSGFQKQTVTPFVHLGNIYIKFAAEHKKLFAFIFLSENRFGRSMYDLINGSDGNVSREIQSATAQGCANAGNLFTKMWIFIHGAACMTLTGDYDLSEEETIQMLKDSYQAYR